jgi:hypothetical protein
MRLARFSLPAFLIASVVPAAAVPASGLLPHRAVYDLDLDSASERSGITGIEGRMVYEFAGSPCEGYTVTFRFVTRIDTSEASRMTDQQTTTYEDGAGANFSFVTRSFIDSELDKELRGNARIEPDATVVSIEEPETETLTLEATQFPTQHLIELIDKAEGGETFYETTLYDGSDEADKVMTTTVIIGKQAAVRTTDPERAAVDDLGDDPFWPVDIAYFDLSEADGEEFPTYRISFKLHESGVTRDLVMDYGDFSMTGTLVDLSMFEAPEACAD